MTSTPTPNRPLIGFIHIAWLNSHTAIGGLLVVNRLARPVEFHCCEPVTANRAQQVLYGPTLPAFLVSEQIAPALVEHCQLELDLLLSDAPEVLAIRPQLSIPVAAMAPRAQGVDPCQQVPMGGETAWAHGEFPDDAVRLEQLLQGDLVGWDLTEPLERVALALTELRKAA